MKQLVAVVLFVFQLEVVCGQFVQLNTGTNSHLMDLSVINGNISVCGTFSYLVKSTDGCNSFTPITKPGPSSYANQLQRLDVNNLNILAYTPSQILVYQSYNGGNSWKQIIDTSGMWSCHMNFLDINTGFVTFGRDLLMTKNGGVSWTSTSFSNTIYGLDVVKTYGDSIVCLGGGALMTGVIFHSKDAGKTWLQNGIVGGSRVADFFFLNEDTIFCTGNGEPSGFALTTNGGQTWIQRQIPIDIAFGINFKSRNEGYVVGATSQTMGVILKTEDLGQTWSVCNTGIKSCLFKMEFLDDSTALLSGSDGVLLKWNYKKAIYVGLNENYIDNIGLKIYPNPVLDNLHFEYENNLSDVFVTITNTLGQTVFSRQNFDIKEEIEVSFLDTGVYYLKIKSEKGEKVFKFFKE